MINYQEFSEKKVLVTGSSRGIGLAIAKNFAQTGAKVILHGKNENSLKIIRAEFEESGWNVDHVICDLSNVSAVRQMAKNILNNEGRIDILVNNAGINLRNPLKMISDSDWHQTLSTRIQALKRRQKQVVFVGLMGRKKLGPPSPGLMCRLPRHGSANFFPAIV